MIRMSLYLLGVSYAITSSILFAFNSVITRRGVYTGHIFEAVSITILVGIPLFLVASVFSHEIFKIPGIYMIFIFALVGVLHFIVGRYLFYNSIHYIGASSSTSVIAVDQIFAVLIAIPILRERLNPVKTIGIFLSITGILILTYTHFGSIMMKKGVLLALSSALIFGLTPVLIRYGLSIFPKPYLAAFISYLSASTIFLLPQGRNSRNSLENLSKKVLIYIFIAALLVDFGQLLRYLALNYIEVSILSPIYGTISIQVVIYSYILNRKYEEVDIWKVISAIIISIGVILVVYSGV